jgi:RNA polymerase sigma factor (sigma-70 family)
VVLAAAANPSEQADRALAELCADYWYPLYTYVRRRGYGAEDARDLTQAFFARLLEKNGLTSAEPARGRFRSFLLTSMKNFLASEWRRQATLKRGGDVEVVSIDYEDAEYRYRVELADALTPEAIYERRWALALLEHAIDDVGKRYADRGKAEVFEALKEYLGYDPGGVPYVELSRRLGQSEGALRTALSRLRARWRSRLRELVVETVQEGHMVDDELNGLIRALTPLP